MKSKIHLWDSEIKFILFILGMYFKIASASNRYRVKRVAGKIMKPLTPMEQTHYKKVYFEFKK